MNRQLPPFPQIFYPVEAAGASRLEEPPFENSRYFSKKMKQFSPFQFAKNLLQFSPRQGKGEQATAQFLHKTLSNFAIPLKKQEFVTLIPDIRKAQLWVDSQQIPCRGTCFQSGKITHKKYLISSLTSSQSFLTQENINFNPLSKSISLANFYFAPAVAVKAKDLSRILRAQKIKAEVQVSPQKYTSANLLVGNLSSPRQIVFAHYDCIETGAIDNASGVATLMAVILETPQLLKNTLFVFAGNEELSYDFPIYWGHGYREFEKQHPSLLQKTRRIWVIDCVGNGPAKTTQEFSLLKLAFPIKNLKRLAFKTYLICADIEKLMTVYHSPDDNLHQLNSRHLAQATTLLKKHLVKK